MLLVSQDANRQYLAHKSILVTRSNYFQTRFNLTSFREADNQHDQFEGHIAKLQMDQASPDTWPTIIRWAYTELVSEESTEGLVEVACHFLMEKSPFLLAVKIAPCDSSLAEDCRIVPEITFKGLLCDVSTSIWNDQQKLGGTQNQTKIQSWNLRSMHMQHETLKFLLMD